MSIPLGGRPPFPHSGVHPHGALLGLPYARPRVAGGRARRPQLQGRPLLQESPSDFFDEGIGCVRGRVVSHPTRGHPRGDDHGRGRPRHPGLRGLPQCPLGGLPGLGSGAQTGEGTN
ncbi:unnamed protein product, partial [Cyprideis torosa]